MAARLITLADPMQLIDELSMIYTTCLMCFASISFQKSLPFRFLAGTFLVALAIFITVSKFPWSGQINIEDR
jgi:dihydroceramidase